MVRRPGFVIIATCLTIVLLTTVAAQQGGRGGAGPTVSIRAARLLDGRGRTLANGVIEVQGSKIVTVDQRSGPVTYDLGDATLLPGLIDVHVHLNWYFGPDGRYGGRGVLPGFATDAVLDNARATLMAGFTTVQSVGWIGDKPLREAIAAGVVNGPRILTSLGQLQGGSSTPQELRETAARSGAEGDKLGSGVRWIRSYVLAEEDGTLGTVCIYQARDEDAVREHAGRVEMPADEILEVADTVVIRPDPQPEGAAG